MKNRPTFYLLGPFRATTPSGTEIDFGHRKVLALLAYLAVEHERAHPREHLASLLWSRTGDDRARHNLRQALSKLRSLCPDLIRTSGDTVTLNPDACTLDVTLFESGSRSQEIEELQKAMGLYRGDLLEGYAVREADFQDWLEVARSRLRQTASAIAKKLADQLIVAGRNEEAIEQLYKLISFDQANESAHQELMRLLAKTGRRSDALRQYQSCISALARELDVEPAEETRRLADEIRQGQVQKPAQFSSESGAQARTTTILAVSIAMSSRQSALGTPDQIADKVHQAVSENNGTILASTEGEILAFFASAAEAVHCATQSQHKHGASDGGAVRMGLDCGPIESHQGQSRGDAIDTAKRLATLIPPGNISVSAAVRSAIPDSLNLNFQFIGEYQATSAANPFSAYRVIPTGRKPESTISPDQQPSFSLPGKPSLLLKPFDNLSDDSKQDYFAEGLTKDISIALTKIPGLFLALDETPHAQASLGQSPGVLGKTFGVRYVLCGGVRRHGERVRVNAELIDSTTGQCIWGERYDRELSDLFTIQDEITEEIVTAMDVKLIQGEDARFMRKSLPNPAALEAMYHGWYALYHGSGRHGILEAQRLFEQVTLLEPESPLGYASLALACWAEAGFGRVVVESEPMRRAAGMARKALELGDTTGYANLVLAVEHLGQQEYEEALAQSTEGVSARPNCNGAYAIKSSILNFLGRSEEAIELAQYAVRLTPVYPAEFPAVLAACFHDSGRYNEAIGAAEASLGLRKDDIDPMLFLTASKVAQDRIDEARELAARIMQLDPDFKLADFAKTQPYRNQHDLERLIDRLRQSGLPD